MRTQLRRSKTIAAMGMTAALLVAGFATATPATAAADCKVGLISDGAAGRSKPYIDCDYVSGVQARGRADCTAAPDTYTKWVRSYSYSEGGYCLFGARGAIMLTRAA